MNKKLFKITINGRTYEVEVEELTGSAGYREVAQTSSTFNLSTSTPATSPSTSTVSPSVSQVVSAPPKEEKKKPSAGVSEAGGTPIKAPMPGKILRVSVKEGDTVSRGDLLLVLEAMKMENEIFAPTSGVVKRIAVSPGDSVNTGDLLVLLG